MKGAICLLLSEHRTMVFRSYSSADYEQKRLAFFKLQKSQSRKTGLQVPVPSKVGVVQVAKDFGYKISVQLQIPSFQGAKLCAKIFIFQAAKQGRRRRPCCSLKNKRGLLISSPSRTILWASSVCKFWGRIGCFPNLMICDMQ